MSFVIENFSSPLNLSVAQSAVLRTLHYFNIFNHPLTSKEIFELAQEKALSEKQTDAAIEDLRNRGLIHSLDGFYFLNSNTDSVAKRLNGEMLASAAIMTAMKYSKLISKFPFVRAVALSGSLSKKCMDKESDIDYFIITSSGRMWVARTFLILFKKIFLLNSRKNFCVNYFLSEDALSVPDKNIFTATEVSFLIPTYNYSLYKNFRKANAWSDEFLPHFPLRQEEFLVPDHKNKLKLFFEKLLSGSAGEKLDNYCFRLTLKFWKKKFRHFDESTFDFRLRSRKNVSKHHPLGFQEKVLNSYSQNMISFTRAHQILLHAEDPVYA